MSSKNVNEILRYGGHRCMFTWIYFQAITYQKNSFKLRNTSAPLSYTRVREMILWSAFESIGLNKYVTVCIDWDQEVQQQHPLQVSMIESSKCTGRAKDGYVKENKLRYVVSFKKCGHLVRIFPLPYPSLSFEIWALRLFSFR